MFRFIPTATVLLAPLWPAPALARQYGDLPAVVSHHCYDGGTCTFTLPGLHRYRLHTCAAPSGDGAVVAASGRAGNQRKA